MRRGLLALTVLLLLAATLAACGSASGTTTDAPDNAGDAEILNRVLAREMAAIGAYGRVLPSLHGVALATAREFRAQEQEHVDAIVKSLRGLGEKAAPEDEEIEASRLNSRRDALDFLYAVESVSVADDLRAVSNLTAPWPRTLLASIAANHAQHLVLLRRGLGADVAELVPEAYEDGTTPAPGEPGSPG